MKTQTHWTLVFLMIGCLLGCEPRSATTDESGQTEGDSLGLPDASGDTLDSLPSIVRTDSTKPESGIRQYIEGMFTVPAAMEVIYGLYDKNIECSKWLCKPHEAKRFESKAMGKGTLHTRAAGTFPIETAEGKKMLLLTETLSREKDDWEDCHACAPILGAAMFEQIDGAWFIEALQKDLGEMGSWGQLPANKLVKIGPDMYGVLFNEGYTGQGITEGEISIVGLVDGEFKLLITENTSYSNEGVFADAKSEPKAFSYDSEISFQDKEPGKPYYLQINRKGRQPSDGHDGSGPIEEFNETLTYKIVKGAYKLIDN